MNVRVKGNPIIKEILEIGKNNGKISLNELNDRLSEIDICVEDIEKIYEKLEKIGVTAPQITRLMDKLCGVNVCRVCDAVDCIADMNGGVANA